MYANEGQVKTPLLAQQPVTGQLAYPPSSYQPPPSSTHVPFGNPVDQKMQPNLRSATCNHKKFHRFEIQLQPAHQVYFPGQNVTGQLIIHPKQAYKARNVKVRLSGKIKTKVDYTERRDGNTHHRTAHQTITLFQTRNIVWPPLGSNETHLQPQQYILPFNFLLPSINLPSSFEGGRHGHIRYALDCNIDVAWWFDPKILLPITILELIDVNNPSYTIPTPHSEIDKTLCCLCCASGPLTLSGYLEHNAFSPGEQIKVFWSVNNSTGKDMGQLKAILIKKTLFRARHHRKYHTQKISEICILMNVPATIDGLLKSTSIAIPPLVPTINSPTIVVSYRLKLCVCVPSGIDLTLEFPFIVGSTQRLIQSIPSSPPLNNQNVPQFWDEPPPAYGENEPANLDTMDNFVINGLAPSAPPPMFGENVNWQSMVNDSEKSPDEGHINYLPQYPVYT